MKISYLWKEVKYYYKLGNGNLQRMGLKFIFAKTPVKKMVNKTCYNKFYSRVIKKGCKIPPKTFQIENTNLCNAKCIMCPHTVMKRKPGTMNQADFEKMCKNTLDYLPINLVIITGFGEPLIDPGIIDKVKWLNKNYPKVDIDIYTNASLMTEELSKKLLELKIHKINFSINGTEESYQKIMGLDYPNTKKNILKFLELKGKGRPLINISLVIVKENNDDIEKIIQFWHDKVDSVMAYSPSDWAGSLKNASVITTSPFKNKTWPCPALWSVVTADVKGDVVMCCRDYESNVKFGNLLEHNILDIRNSDMFQELLKKHQAFDFKVPVCSSCDNCFNSTLNWWAIK